MNLLSNLIVAVFWNLSNYKMLLFSQMHIDAKLYYVLKSYETELSNDCSENFFFSISWYLLKVKAVQIWVKPYSDDQSCLVLTSMLSFL